MLEKKVGRKVRSSINILFMHVVCSTALAVGLCAYNSKCVAHSLAQLAYALQIAYFDLFV